MELALPILALGGLYISANQGKSKSNKPSREGFANEPNLPNTHIPPQNYPVINERELVDTTTNYPNSNIATDKYFNQNYFENSGAHTNEIQGIYSLTGDYRTPSDFKHNNMIPFYSGNKLGGQLYNNNVAESLLDNLSGGGSQIIRK